MADFLLEIGTEEIPPGYLDGAAKDLAKRLGKELNDAGLLSFIDREGFEDRDSALYRLDFRSSFFRHFPWQVTCSA